MLCMYVYTCTCAIDIFLPFYFSPYALWCSVIFMYTICIRIIQILHTDDAQNFTFHTAQADQDRCIVYMCINTLYNVATYVQFF